ncbi:hypothetical protein ACXR8U_13775 [Methylobacterium radiotolerans]|jgi:hypothetical protein|uniref:hypothetical protein n=1 Tax=Methylobacterium TaxID=407 RepID=UPI0005E2AD5E|nr:MULTISPECIES: hypothetical protein [Methylobacterium]GAN49705.1 hypothetical protein ME121_3736 [Methylobacterium sp. ME121]
MLVRRVTPAQRAQMAREALRAIAGFKARLALLEMQARMERPALWVRLALKGARAFLDRWERQERRVLREQ